MSDTWPPSKQHLSSLTSSFSLMQHCPTRWSSAARPSSLSHTSTFSSSLSTFLKENHSLNVAYFSSSTTLVAVVSSPTVSCVELGSLLSYGNLDEAIWLKAHFLQHSRMHCLQDLTVSEKIFQLEEWEGSDLYLDVRVWIQWGTSSTQIGAFHKHVHNFSSALAQSNMSFSFSLDEKKKQSGKSLELHHQPSAHLTGPAKTWAVWS